MELNEWLYQNRMTQGEMAKAVGVTRGTICNIATGANCASLATALRIESLTGGEVTAASLLQHYNEKQETVTHGQDAV